jgi:hypothetical protein
VICQVTYQMICLVTYLVACLVTYLVKMTGDIPGDMPG